jgi:diguanylate cyclase (GGDEF)-like protein
MGLLRTVPGGKTLRWKTSMAFMVMSVIPTLALLYFLTGQSTAHGYSPIQVGVVFFACIWLMAAGYIMIRQTASAISGLANDARAMAAGRYDPVSLGQPDAELRDIAESVNSMTSSMRGYIIKLGEYGERTAVLDRRIQKKVAVLTNLIKIGEMISSGDEFSKIARFAVEGIQSESDEGFAMVLLKRKNSRDYRVEAMIKAGEKCRCEKDLPGNMMLVESLFGQHEYVLLDADPLAAAWQKELRKKLGGMNAVFFPIISPEGIEGIVAAGVSGEKVLLGGDYLEVVRVFANELSLAYRSMRAGEKIRSLEIMDKVTGLYSPNYMIERLSDEVTRAVFYRRPCSLVLVDVDRKDNRLSELSREETSKAMLRVGAILKEFCPPAGKVGMFGPFEFGLILPEVNKRGSFKIGKEIRGRIEEHPGGGLDITASIGLGENPIDGASGEEILAKSREFVQKAKQSGGNTVVCE